MLKRTLKILRHLLQNLEFMFDHLCLTSLCFWTLSIKVSSFVFCLPLTLVVCYYRCSLKSCKFTEKNATLDVFQGLQLKQTLLDSPINYYFVVLG